MKRAFGEFIGFIEFVEFIGFVEFVVFVGFVVIGMRNSRALAWQSSEERQYGWPLTEPGFLYIVTTRGYDDG